MVEVSFDEWPLLITTARGRPEAADVDRMIAASEKAFLRVERYASVVDATQVTAIPSARDRQRYAEWRRAHFEELRSHVIAAAMAPGNRPLLRGVMTAVG